MRVVKQAFRTLFRTPFLTGVAVVSLALGIGANAAIFSIFDQFLLRSLPVEAPEELVNVGNTGPNWGSTSCGMAGDCNGIYSYPMFRDLEAARVGFASLAGHRESEVNLAMADRTVNGRALLVSGSYFETLGVQPTLGRLLTRDDDQRIGGHFVAVLGHDFWAGELGADRGVLNQTLTINGQPFTVVGVAPAGFQGTTLGAIPDVYVPLTMRTALSPTWEGYENRRSYWIYVFGRLEPGVTLAQAQERLNTVYGNIITEVEAPLQSGASASAMERFVAKRPVLEAGDRGQSDLHAESRTPLLFLLGITGLVLLIACANVANLLLARGAQRRVEIAVRSSLGAGRRRLLVQLLTESVLLAILGGVASILVALWTVRAMGRALPAEVTRGLVLEVSPSMLLFTGAVALGTGFLFGLFPALHSTRTDLVTIIKGSSGQSSGSRAAHRFRSTLVTAQIALSMTLLVVSGLFVKSLVNVSRVELGLNTESLATFVIAPGLNGYEDERNRALFDRTRDELHAIPGVTRVSSAMVPVLAGSSWGTDVLVQGFDNESPDVDRHSRYNVVGPGFFSTLEMPLVAGREFTEADGEGAPEVMVINEAFARKFNLDPRNAVGTLVGLSGEGRDEAEGALTRQVVGVVQDAAYASVKDDVPPIFFLPRKQTDNVRMLAWYVRTATDPAPVLQAIPATIRTLDANLPVTRLRRMQEQVEENIFADRLISYTAGAFAILATLLAAIGLYGVLAYTVTQRTREIGLRMALGAESTGIQGLVLGQVGRMLAVGGVVGIVAAVGLGSLAESILFGMEGTDLTVIAAATVLLALVSFASGILPARRAAKVDPMEALRYE